MNRRQLVFLVLVNALVSLMLVLVVVWVVEWRRPDPEELASLSTTLVQPANSAPPELGVQAAPLAGDGTEADAPADGLTDEAAESGEGNADAVETLPTATGVPPTPLAEQTTYTVRAGDSLSLIAQRYNIDVDDLVAINEITNPNNLFVGQDLVLPISAEAVATVDARPAPAISTPAPAASTEADNSSDGAFNSGASTTPLAADASTLNLGTLKVGTLNLGTPDARFNGSN